VPDAKIYLRKAARGRAVRHEAAEQLAVLGDELVQGIGHASSDDAVAQDRAVPLHEAPALEALAFRQGSEKVSRHEIVERDERQTAPAIEADDDTRRPAAEASAGVVQENGAAQGHRALSKPSSVARTSGPIVSST
jgi:hypothetical protein